MQQAKAEIKQESIYCTTSFCEWESRTCSNYRFLFFSYMHNNVHKLKAGLVDRWQNQRPTFPLQAYWRATSQVKHTVYSELKVHAHRQSFQVETEWNCRLISTIRLSTLNWLVFYLMRTLKNVSVPAYVRRGHSRSAVIMWRKHWGRSLVSIYGIYLLVFQGFVQKFSLSVSFSLPLALINLWITMHSVVLYLLCSHSSLKFASNNLKSA